MLVHVVLRAVTFELDEERFPYASKMLREGAGKRPVTQAARAAIQQLLDNAWEEEGVDSLTIDHYSVHTPEV